MISRQGPSRRAFIRKWLLGAALGQIAVTSVGSAHAAAASNVTLPLLSPGDPEAIKVRYTEDAAQANPPTKGNKCANCALYEGEYNSAQGPCQIFPGKHVRASGWCSSWAPQI